MEPSDYWRLVGAPKIAAKKEELGRKVSNTSIAAAIEKGSGKNTARQLFEAFMSGEREPYISQLVAMCDALGLKLSEVLQPSTTVQRRPAIHSVEKTIPRTSERKRSRSQTAG